MEEEDNNDEEVRRKQLLLPDQQSNQEGRDIINNKQVTKAVVMATTSTSKKEFLELGELTKTRKLYVEGNNINEFVSFLQRATKTLIKQVRQEEVVDLKPSYHHHLPSLQQDEQQQQPQLIRKGVIRFWDCVPTSTIQKVLENSSLNLRILVSKSSSKDDNSFFSSSSQSQSSSSSQPSASMPSQQQRQQIIITNHEQQLLLNNSISKAVWSQKDKIFDKLARLLIENPSWGFAGLVNYINTSVEVDERDSFFGVMSEKINDLENAVKLGKMMVQQQQQNSQTAQCKQQQQQQEIQQPSFIQQGHLFTQEQQQQQKQQEVIEIEDEEKSNNAQELIQLQGTQNSNEINKPQMNVRNRERSISPLRRQQDAEQKSIDNNRKGYEQRVQKQSYSLSNDPKSKPIRSKSPNNYPPSQSRSITPQKHPKQ